MDIRARSLAAALLLFAPYLLAAQQPGRPTRPQNQMGQCSMMGGMHDMMMGMMPDHPMPMGGQRPGMQGMQGMQGMKGMQGGGMSDSMHLSQMRSELGLSDAQMQQIRAIHQRTCTAAQPHLTMAMQAHEQAMQALQGESPNIDTFHKQLQQAAAHMVEAQTEMAKGMLEAHKVLTPEQRQKMDRMRQQMMQQMMPGAKPGAGDHQARHAPPR